VEQTRLCRANNTPRLILVWLIRISASQFGQTGPVRTQIAPEMAGFCLNLSQFAHKYSLVAFWLAIVANDATGETMRLKRVLPRPRDLPNITAAW